MRTAFVLLISFCWCFSTRAQVVSGKITSQEKSEPLPGATVIADDTNAVSADASGNYSIKLQPGSHTLVFRLISFTHETRTVRLAEGEEMRLDVSLKPESHQLNIVVVSAGRFEQNIEDVTVSMEVLKPDLIDKRNSTAMDEAIENMSGVTIIDGQANIRGGSGWSYGAGSRVQVLVDDLPQLTADAADTKWNFLPVENLAQVEVIKGASSVLFGSSALNGVINIRTAYPTDTPVTKVHAFSGIYDKAYITLDSYYSLAYQKSPTYFHGTSFMHGRKLGNLDLVAGGNWFKDEGYRQGENENRVRLNFNTRYRFKVPGLQAGINANGMINKATIFFLWKNDNRFAYVPADNTLSDTKTYRLNVDPYLNYTTSGGTSHKLRTRWFLTNNKNNTNQDSRGDLYYMEYQYQRRFFDKLSLTGGLVQIFSVVKSELYGDHDGSQQAGYVQGDLSLNRLTLSAGMRAEQSKVDTIRDEWTPVFRAGLAYRILSSTYVRASAGQGYRFPSVAERFVRTRVSGVRIFPNESLEPEKGFSLEAGIRQTFKLGSWKGFIDGAVFQNEYKNMMEFAFAMWDNSPSLFDNFGFKSVNVGKTRIRGFEINLMAEGKWDEYYLTVQGGYTYIDPVQLTYDSAYSYSIGLANVRGSDSTDFLKYRSRHTLKADVEVGRGKVSTGFTVRYASRIVNIDRIFVSGFLDIAFPPGLGIEHYRKYHTGGDLVLDYRISYEFTKAIRGSFLVKNFLNHIYMQRPADMQPPRTYTLQVACTF